jgi:hypothetical protein
MRCFVASFVGGVLLAASTDGPPEDLDDQRGQSLPDGFRGNGPLRSDTNVSLKGTLYFTRHGDDGTVDGTLADEGGFSVPVHGQILGRAANLLFDLGNDAFVYGPAPCSAVTGRMDARPTRAGAR